ncbi:hypothetical protein CCP2SC5_200028 [Azospirillaceae bacterium]
MSGVLWVANNMVMESETAHVLQTCRMLGAFAESGLKVFYVWPFFGRMVSGLEKLPIERYPLMCRLRRGAGRYAEFLIRLLWLLFHERPFLLFTRSLGVAFAAQIFSQSVVLELHQDLSKRARLALPLLGRRVRIVAISDSLRQHLISAYDWPSDRVISSHDGVDFNRFAQAQPFVGAERPAPSAEGSPIHLYYGALRPERGLGMIAAAARALPKHGFVLVGGSQAEVEAALLDGLDLPNVLVRSAMRHEQMPRLIRSYDSVILPYTRAVKTWRWMSPLKLFEVLAAGVPAVVSRLGPISEVVESQHVTFLEDENPQSLIEALEALAQDMTLARAKAMIGQKLMADAYSWEGRAEKILAFGCAGLT